MTRSPAPRATASLRSSGPTSLTGAALVAAAAVTPCQARYPTRSAARTTPASLISLTENTVASPPRFRNGSAATTARVAATLAFQATSAVPNGSTGPSGGPTTPGRAQPNRAQVTGT